jgi:predicted Zn-dependent protease
MRSLQQEALDSPLGWYGEGVVHLAQNAPAAAIAPLERAVRNGPRLGPAQALLGEAYARAGRRDEALRARAVVEFAVAPSCNGLVALKKAIWPPLRPFPALL